MKHTAPIPKQLLALFSQPAEEQTDPQSTHFHFVIHQVFFPPQFVLECMCDPDVYCALLLYVTGLSGAGTVTTPTVSTGKTVPDGKYTTVICCVSVAGSVITGRIDHIPVYLCPLRNASFQLSVWASVSGKFAMVHLRYKEFDLV